MTWLTEFGQVMYQSTQLLGIVAGATLKAAEAALLAGAPEKLLVALPDGVRIDDPWAGRVEGRDVLEAYCAPGSDSGTDRSERP